MNLKKVILCLAVLFFIISISAAAASLSTISTAAYVNFAIKEDGSLIAWGKNDYGLLGDSGDGVSHLDPVSLMKNARSVAGGRNCVLVIDSNNVLWGIGSNWFGMLASHGDVEATQPVVIMRNVAEISAGERHCLALKTDGSLWGWGLNEFGQLGHTERDSSKPYDGLLLSPVKLMDQVKSVGCSSYGSYALKEDGRLLAWGSQPTQSQAGSYDWDAPEELMDDILSIEDFGFIKNDHSLWGWVSQDAKGGGEQFSFEKIMDDVKQSSSGGGYFAVVKTDGSLWTWGSDNSLGQLGNGTAAPNSSPQKIMEHVLMVDCSREYSLILDEDGSLWQTGYSHATARSLPAVDKTEFYTPYLLMDGVRTSDVDLTNIERDSNHIPFCPLYWLVEFITVLLKS